MMASPEEARLFEAAETGAQSEEVINQPSCFVLLKFHRRQGSALKDSNLCPTGEATSLHSHKRG